MHIPILYPGDPEEALDLGRHAIALSRCTGLWTSLKIVADVADNPDYAIRPITETGLTRRMYAATRDEDAAKPFMAHFFTASN